MTSKQCPQCGTIYDGEGDFCPSDGSRLMVQESGDGLGRRRSLLSRVPKETVAGLLIVAVLLLAIGAVFMYRQTRVFHLRVRFEDGHGLRVGDSVFVRGVQVGEVTEIIFEGRSRILATLDIKPDAAEQIREGSDFFVGFENVVPQKRCIIVYVMDQAKPPIQNGTTIDGEDSIFKYYWRVVQKYGLDAANQVVGELIEELNIPVPDWFKRKVPSPSKP